MTLATNQEYPKASKPMYYGAIITFAAGILLVISFASPYWLQSYHGSFSPLKNMGLWEYCFENYRHPAYQLPTVFDGCHNIFSYKFHVIREYFLPGWLMTVQTFVCLALILSFVAQISGALTICRWPLKFVLKNEWLLTAICFGCNALAAVLLLLSVLIFGNSMWRRDWFMYPNWNHVSWSYVFALISCLLHIIAAVPLYFDTRRSYDMRRENRPFSHQMYPSHQGVNDYI